MNSKMGDRLTLSYQYGSLNNMNNSYKKLAANKPVLSPYTFWTMRIKAVKEEREKELLNKIDSLLNGNVEIRVFLYGNGQYVESLTGNTC